MAIEAELGGGWSGRQLRCGWHRNNGERTVVLGSCDYARGLEMTTLGRARRGVGASDNGCYAVREPDAGVFAVAVGGKRWAAESSNDRGEAMKRLRAMAAVVSVESAMPGKGNDMVGGGGWQ
ncbi:hypothetical protein B296_00052636 [Ensete ventricosum]|uniref:Uncharacterized protein n=1 Tax=Ensete ventricosum TaxID=4639 RepID=A0A426XLH3_ENSVE|nr:hypothetical protein B296_00052636 [Ensete ventricosum]